MMTTTNYAIGFASEADLDFAEETENSALKFVLLFAVLQTIMLLIFDWARTSIPLVGELNSVGGHALITGVIIALVVSPVAYIRGVRFRGSQRPAALQLKRNWGVVPLTIGITLLVAMLIIMGFSMAAEAFVDLSLDLTSTLMVLVILAGGLAYIITRALMLARTSALFVNLSVFYLFATLFFATYFQDNPSWWQNSFSYLGMSESNSRLIFNVGLVFTGILVVVWQLYFMEKFKVLRHVNVVTPRAYQIIHWILILTGVLLAFVGIFRFGVSTLTNIIHDISATGMGVLIGLLMLFLDRLVPGYRPIFYTASIVMVLLIVAAAVLKVVGHFNLVGLELAGFTLAGLWLLLFERNTNLLVAQTVVKSREEKN